MHSKLGLSKFSLRFTKTYNDHMNHVMGALMQKLVWKINMDKYSSFYPLGVEQMPLQQTIFPKLCWKSHTVASTCFPLRTIGLSLQIRKYVQDLPWMVHIYTTSSGLQLSAPCLQSPFGLFAWRRTLLSWSAVKWNKKLSIWLGVLYHTSRSATDLKDNWR